MFILFCQIFQRLRLFKGLRLFRTLEYTKDPLRSGYGIGESHKFNLKISYNSRKFQAFNLYAMQCLHLPSLTLHSIHAVTEVISLGLQTTVHPAINAGPILKLIKVMVSIREVVHITFQNLSSSTTVY